MLVALVYTRASPVIRLKTSLSTKGRCKSASPSSPRYVEAPATQSGTVTGIHFENQRSTQLKRMPRIPTLAILSVLLIGAGGCKTAPLRYAGDAGAEIPTQWTGARVATHPATPHWVDSFGDPNLSGLIHSGLANNYDLKAAATRLDAAIAQARIDGSGLFPQISFITDHQRVQVREAGFGSARFAVFDALFSLSWEMDVWGRIRDVRQAALLEAGAVASDLNGARLSLAARIAQSYFDLAEARLQSEVAEQSVKDRRTIVQLVRGRFARGITNALDLRLALTDLANAEVELNEARNQIQFGQPPA